MKNETPTGKYMSRRQRRELIASGQDLCSKCKTYKPLIDFKNGTHVCKQCAKQMYLNWKLRNPNYKDKYQEENKEHRSKYIKKWREEHREQVKETGRKWMALRCKTDPSWALMKRLRSSLRNLKNNRNSQRSLYYVGINSPEEFLTLMTNKTENKSWISDGWHLDHIWQIRWFSEALKNPADELIKAVSRHQNLRPLSPKENRLRDKFDFSPLDKNDFELYKEYLNKDVLEKMEKHFAYKESLSNSLP